MITRLIEQLPDIVATERKQLIQDLAREAESLRILSSEIRQTIDSGNNAAVSINQAVLSADVLTQRLLANFSQRPFVIKDYLATAKQVAETAQELNNLLNTVDLITASDKLDERLLLIERMYDSMLLRIFIYAMAFLVAFFFLLFFYRFATQRYTGLR